MTTPPVEELGLAGGDEDLLGGIIVCFPLPFCRASELVSSCIWVCAVITQIQGDVLFRLLNWTHCCRALHLCDDLRCQDQRFPES